MVLYIHLVFGEQVGMATHDQGYLYLNDLKAKLASTGKPMHPGPVSFTIASHNVTSLATAYQTITSLDVQYLCCQEISAPGHQIPAMASQLQESQTRCILTAPDSKLTHTTGGVGVIFGSRWKAVKLTPQFEIFSGIVTNGRVQLFGLPLPTGCIMLVFNFYAWSGAHTCAEPAERPNSMVEAILDEMTHYHVAPCLSLGDLNADIADITSVASDIDDGIVQDIGSLSALGPTTPTCRPPNGGRPTRRDYMFAIPSLVPYITSFAVRDLHLPVHSALFLSLSFPDVLPQVVRYFKSEPIISQIKNVSQAVQMDSQEPIDHDSPQLKAALKQFSENVVKHINSVDNALQDAYRAKDVDLLWEIWTSNVAEAISITLSQLNPDSKQIFKEVQQMFH